MKSIIDVPPSLPTPGGTPGRKIASSLILQPVAVQVRQVVIDENAAGQRLDNFLIKCLKGVPKTHIYRLIRSGEVRVNKGRAQADTRLEIGQIIRIPPVRVAQRADPPCKLSLNAKAAVWKIDTVFEDDWFMVLNKPAGVAVHGGSGVSLGVIEQLRLLRSERIVSRRRAGKHIFYSLADAHVSSLIQSAIEHAAETHAHEPKHDD